MGDVFGRFVAASNMGQYVGGLNPNTISSMLYGPYENPGVTIDANGNKKGSIYDATNGGKKVMKVCWTIKDLLAAQTNNTQHSHVTLRVKSNWGTNTP